LSEDHKPSRNDEHDRIESDGGAVIWAGTWRVSGVLAVSRAFGDRALKKFVISLPDVRHDAMAGGEEYVVLASDGLWDVIANRVCCWHVRAVIVSLLFIPHESSTLSHGLGAEP
jgi:protein phosphatase 1L